MSGATTKRDKRRDTRYPFLRKARRVKRGFGHQNERDLSF
jgi:hypothetical protein